MGPNSVSFTFQKPLEITAEDIVNKTKFNLTLAFNPHGIVQGVLADSSAGGATNFPPLTDNSIGNGYNLGNTISTVGGQVAPVFFKSTDTVMRETYLATIEAGGNNGYYDYRVEFYYLKNDEKSSIYGINTGVIPNADTKGYLIGTYPITQITTGSDGSLSLTDENNVVQIKGLNRITSVGSTTTAKLFCDPVSMNCTAGQDVDVTFTLTARDELP
jgi:hypothetical protein